MGIPIKDLSSADEVAAGDLVAAYVSINSDTRKVAMSVLQAYMQANLDFAEDLVSAFVNQTETVINGFSVQVTNGNDNIFLVLLGTGTLATGTIVMPDANGIVDKQEVLVSSLPAVTTLTVSGNGGFFVTGPPTTLAADGFFKMRYDINNNGWFLVG